MLTHKLEIKQNNYHFNYFYIDFIVMDKNFALVKRDASELLKTG